jgi:hypothetical protein
MNLRVEVYQRDWSGPFIAQSIDSPLAPKVKSYSFSAIGGPKRAELVVQAGRNTLMAYLNSLRCPVKIFDHLGNVVWWGLVWDVQIKSGSINVGVTLDSMANKISLTYAKTVAPFYTDSVTGEVVHHVYNPGIAGTLSASDLTSIGEYGTREMHFDASSNGYTKTQAEQTRDTLLTHRKLPIPVVALANGKEPDGATLICRGWWETLDWQYYANPLGLYSYTNGGGGKATYGDAADSLAVKQDFWPVLGGWYPNKIRLNVMKEGVPYQAAPGDGLAAIQLTFYNNAGGIVASANILDASVPTDLDWVEWALTPGAAWAAIAGGAARYSVELQGNWIGLHPNDFYWCALDTGKAPPSGFKEWNGGAWVSRPKAADGHMLLQVTDEVETIDQLDTLLTASAQFMTGTVIRDTTATGIYSSQYRGGDKTAAEEVSDLLKAGTTNNRRMLTLWDADNNIHLKEEPASTELQYIYHRDGSLTNMYNAPIPNYLCPAGCWIRIDEVVDAGGLFMADATRMFVEEAEYNAEKDTIRLTSKDDINPLDIFVLKNPGTDMENTPGKLPGRGQGAIPL